MSATTRQKPRRSANTTMISSWADVVATAAESRLLKSSYVELRRVSCEFHEGVITLRGRVPRYYLKQVAQNLVGRPEGVVEVDNQLNVGPPPG